MHVSAELIFHHALTLAKSREDVTVNSVLSYPIGPVPTSMFHDDGTMRKTAKAELGQKLDEVAETKHELPDFDKDVSIYIRDAMALIQAMHGTRHTSFGSLAMDYMNRLMKGFNSANTVVEVFDRYDIADTVKYAERERRANNAGVGFREYEMVAGHPVPHWKRFLNVASNKEKLERFLCDFTVKTASQQLASHPERKLYIAGGFANPEAVKLLHSQGLENVHALYSNQEVADT